MKYYRGPISDHFNGSHFYNPWNKRKFSWFQLLRWIFTRKKIKWPEFEVKKDVPPQRVRDKIRISSIGHSTLLIQVDDVNILTDPIYSSAVGPFKLLKIERCAHPGIDFERLPKIDLILLSHNHYDHLDIPTLHRLHARDNPLIIAPLGNDLLLKKINPALHVEALDWGDCKKMRPIEISLEPAQHWSKRTFWDTDRTLWGAFVLKTSKGNIYFAGDSGYSEHFKWAAQKYGAFKLALIPIGAYLPRWFMKYAHIDPREAARAHLDLKAEYSIAIHHSTFKLSDEEFDQPLHDLEKAKLEYGIGDSFRALKIGEALSFE